MTRTELVLSSYPAVFIVQWNQYLSSDQFKINMSHVIKDLAVPADGALRR